MDSFILDVMRGWRLLVAACLSSDEWRDVLASTGNKLDYQSIADALQVLWDEQLGSGKSPTLSSPSSFHHNHWVESWPSDGGATMSNNTTGLMMDGILLIGVIQTTQQGMLLLLIGMILEAQVACW